MNRITLTTVSLALVTFIVVVFQGNRYNNKLVVTFCDVGQGDGAFIRTPSKHDILIDTGPDSSILKCMSEFMPFWDHTIDLIVLSHFNVDHVAGVIDILRRYKVKRIAVSTISTERDDVKKYMTLFKNNGIDINDLNPNDHYKIENNITIQTLGPRDKPGLIEDNNSSLIQILSYKDYDFLFTGDSSFEILNPILNTLGDRIEVLKVPHHGSKTGLSRQSFENFKPKISVISDGKKNRYGHPHKSVLDLLQKNGIEVRRTDIEGNITFVL